MTLFSFSLGALSYSKLREIMNLLIFATSTLEIFSNCQRNQDNMGLKKSVAVLGEDCFDVVQCTFILKSFTPSAQYLTVLFSKSNVICYFLQLLLCFLFSILAQLIFFPFTWG